MTAHIAMRNVSVRIGRTIAVDDVSFDVPRHQIFGIIGPANSGKTTLLKCINRTIDIAGDVHVEGELRVDGENIFELKDVYSLRRRIGMVSPLPVGLPISVYDNVAYAPRLAGVRGREVLDGVVEHCLRRAALWDEVKGRLHELGTRLSGGQQQRLAIARALSHRPEILCLNRFSIAIDPVTTMQIEDMLIELKRDMTIVFVTTLVQQAHRLADRIAFLNHGRVIEVGSTDTIFSEHPARAMTFDYVRGRFG